MAGLGLGRWGLAQWQWWQIQSRIETKAALELDIEECRRTLRELEEQARGVRIVESANGTFVVLPPGTETDWTVGDKAAVKLPDREQRMTELERQLSEALQSLAAQYEREQKRQAELVGGLRKQLRQLDAQVAALAADYRQIAGDYRKIADALSRLSKR